MDSNDEEAYKIAYERYQEQTGGETERLMSGSDDYTLFLWHPKEGKHPIKRMTGHQNLVNHISFSPDGRYVASASFDSKIKLWNGKSGEFMTTLHGHVGAVYQVAWSADSRYLVSASKDSTAKLWEVMNLKNAKETLPGHADEVYALDWSPLGQSVATGSKDRTIKIWKH
jgi:ribosome assembly protein 4